MIQVLITLIVVGVILWLVNAYVPMPGWLKKTINVVAAICVVLYLLNVFGILHYIDDVKVPKIG